MGNKRVTSLYIRLNDNRLIDIEQDKFRQRLDRLHSNWSKLIQKNKKVYLTVTITNIILGNIKEK